MKLQIINQKGETNYGENFRNQRHKIVLTARYIDKDGNKINKDGLHQYSRVHNYKELLHHIYNSDFNCTIWCKVFAKSKTKKVVKFIKHTINKSKDTPDDIISKIADILNIYSERYNIYREYVVYDSKYEDIYSTMKERFTYAGGYDFDYKPGTDDVDGVVEERYRLYLDQIISIIHNIGRKELEWNKRDDVLKYSSLKELFEAYDVLYK